MSSTTLRRASKVGRVDAVQIEYSPLDLDIESDPGTNLLAACRELGVAVVAYSPIGRGLLTGTVSSAESIAAEGDWRGLYPRFTGDNLAANVAVVRQFEALARRKGCTPAQLSVAWVLKQGPDVLPIPGTKKIKYLEENLAAAAVELTDAEEKQIRQIVSGVVGDRVPDFAKPNLFVTPVEEK